MNAEKKRIDRLETTLPKVLLVGNPNVGKSVVFSRLTGKYAQVSNFPGSTVEISSGKAAKGDPFFIIDTPGINNLLPASEDEKVTRDIIFQENYQLIVQVADYKNIRRSLLLTIQLLELEVPVFLVLNMEDEAKSRGITVDVTRLSELLGIPVVTSIATEKIGIRNIRNLIKTYRGIPPKPEVNYSETLLKDFETLMRFLPADTRFPFSLSTMVLSGDKTIEPFLSSKTCQGRQTKIDSLVENVQYAYSKPVSVLINNRRMEHADSIISQVYYKSSGEFRNRSQNVSRLLIHPVWGPFILLIILSAVYYVVGVFAAGFCVDFLEENLFGRLINPLSVRFFNFLSMHPLITDFFVGEFGVITMAMTYAIAIIFPIVSIFFIVFGLLEDSGYLPRLAVIVNRLLKFIGLNGKAVLPLSLGLGCVTMATLTTRILNSKKERLIATFLLALAVPCSAQLGVILGMLGKVSFMGTVIWLAVTVVVIAVSGKIAKKYVPGASTDFMMEIPPLRIPHMKNIFQKTFGRLSWYMKEIVPIFILGTAVLWFLDTSGFLIKMQDLFSPVISKFLGLPKEAANAFMVGFFRRDYGAVGLYNLANEGKMDSIQIVVSMLTITLFVPCVANWFIIIKEQGMKIAVLFGIIILPIAFAVGGIFNIILRLFPIL